MVGPPHEVQRSLCRAEPSRLKELRFQIRPYVWVEFQPISLHPGQKAEPKIVSENNPQPEPAP